MEKWGEGFHQKGKTWASVGYISMVYSRDTEVRFLMSCSLKVTRYIHQPTSQLYSIWMSFPKILYRQVALSEN